MTTLASDNATRAYRRPRPCPSRFFPNPPPPPRSAAAPPLNPRINRAPRHPTPAGLFRPVFPPLHRPQNSPDRDIGRRRPPPNKAPILLLLLIRRTAWKKVFSRKRFFLSRERKRERIWCFEKEEELFLSGEFLSGLGLIDLGREGEVCVIGRGEEGI